MKNFVSRNLSIVSTDSNPRALDEWHDLYQYNVTDNTKKALLLSLLVKNTSSSSSQSDVNLEVYITTSGGGLRYPLITYTEVLSNKDEFYIDRTKQLIVLNPGDKIRIRAHAYGIYAYCSVLENVN